MSLQQFLLILRARALAAFLVLLAAVAAALLFSLLQSKQYVARTDVVIDVKSPDPIIGMVLPALAMPGYMATQVDIIDSDRVAQKVVKLLRLDQNPKVRGDWLAATQGTGRLEVWLGALLRKNLAVDPARTSNVIAISYKSPDPQFSAAVANAFAQAYIDTSIELKVEPARQYSRYFEEQVGQRRAALEAAQVRLSDYQKEKGTLVSDERLNHEHQKLVELQTQLVIAAGQTAEARSKQRAGSDTLQDVMQHPLINQLKADVARSEARRQELASNFGHNHPQYQRQVAELSALQAKLASELRQVASAVGTSGRVSRAKEAELRAAIEAHKQHILRLREARDEASVLQREVETAQRAFELVAQRLTQTELESRNTQTNVAVLTPAEPPSAHSSPRLLVNLLLAVFLGTLCGIGAALLIELLDRRVRSAEDLAASLGLPVLASLRARSRFTWPGRRFFKPSWGRT